MNKSIFCLGNALFDLSTPCKISLLKKYNLKPDENAEATVEHDDLFLYLLQKENTFQSAGGSAQNTAKIAQWVLSTFGEGQVTFVGSIGNDIYGQKLQEHMKNCNVNSIYDIQNATSTGITAALITEDSKRTLCARLGAAASFNSDFLNSTNVQSQLNLAKIIYVESYFLSHNPECVLKLAEFAKYASKTFALNLSAVYICENQFEMLKKCVPLSDIIFGNKEEITAFANKYMFSYSSMENCALEISSLPCEKSQRTTVITQGPDPLIVAIGKTVSSYDIPFIESIADTIGCGDAFVGGFLAALLLNKTVANAVNWGIYCATEITKVQGCTIPSFPPNVKDEI